MILKLKKGTGVQAFLNKDIFYVDVKSVKLDRVLTNLFIKMYMLMALLSICLSVKNIPSTY